MTHKLLALCFIFAGFGSVCFAQQCWLLQATDGHWKKFDKESEWHKAALEIQPLETAVINRTAKEISVVYDVQGESGDWHNVDRYVFQTNGNTKRLERWFVSLSQHIKLIQVFELDFGKLIKKSETETSLTTKQPTTEPLENPPLPIATKLSDLDFMKTK